MTDIILKANNLSYSIQKKNELNISDNIEIIKNISFEVERDTVLGITGGSIEKNLKNDWSRKLPAPIQILFQNDGELTNPYRKIVEVFNEAFEMRNNEKGDYYNDVNEILIKFKLPQSILNHKGYQLSGGEQQRVALARIFITSPEILILDEPFTSQDVEAQLNLVTLIKKIVEESGITIICVSHDVSILKNISKKILIMYDGNIVESGNTADILGNPQNEYTKFLLSAKSFNLRKEEIEIFNKNYEQNKRNQNT
jgi:ABC-type glutathione transport system ATPase component